MKISQENAILVF